MPTSRPTDPAAAISGTRSTAADLFADPRIFAQRLYDGSVLTAYLARLRWLVAHSCWEWRARSALTLWRLPQCSIEHQRRRPGREVST